MEEDIQYEKNLAVYRKIRDAMMRRGSADEFAEKFSKWLAKWGDSDAIRKLLAAMGPEENFSDYPDVRRDEQIYRRMLAMMKKRGAGSDFSSRFSEWVSRLGDREIIRKVFTFVEESEDFSDPHRAKPKDLEGVFSHFGTSNYPSRDEDSLEFSDEDAERDYRFNQSNKAMEVPRHQRDGDDALLEFCDSEPADRKELRRRPVNNFFGIGKPYQAPK